MAHDPARIKETSAWFKKAADDLRGVRIDLDADPPLLADALFHCQQAVEKSLKGFLAWHDRPFHKTHDLAELGSQCIAVDASLDELCRRAEPLTVFATIFRYPGVPEEPSRQEAEDALKIARDVYEAILVRLPAEVKPQHREPTEGDRTGG